jgi:hypothetical protein
VTDACGVVDVMAGGRSQPALADPSGLVLRAAQAALAGHPGAAPPMPLRTVPPA